MRKSRYISRDTDPYIHIFLNKKNNKKGLDEQLTI